jgi:hypothetical protein
MASIERTNLIRIFLDAEELEELGETDRGEADLDDRGSRSLMIPYFRVVIADSGVPARGEAERGEADRDERGSLNLMTPYLLEVDEPGVPARELCGLQRMLSGTLILMMRVGPPDEELLVLGAGLGLCSGRYTGNAGPKFSGDIFLTSFCLFLSNAIRAAGEMS